MKNMIVGAASSPGVALKPASTRVNTLVACVGLLALGGRANAQTFTFAPTQIPQGNPFNNSVTENVDFADIDLDGDWDAGFADGGDNGNDQSRLWVNQAFAQAGTIGFFLDKTSTQAPAISLTSRDIEFVDFDNDLDVDIYLSNSSSLVNQSNHWWTNMGGLQAGTVGFYQDQTSTRWVGLGQPGSSIAPSQVLGAGGFIDWSCDSDFGDIDNDGDLDLVHSSYGGAFAGQVPTRMFLNNGTGVFFEFNPSQFQLPGQNIANGNPGLWCAGTQSANTLSVDGSNCDIAVTALDIDLSDIDGDLDLDLLLGDRDQVPRMFTNLYEENHQQLVRWRDVSAAVFPAGYATGAGHYAQEFGDFDDDGDHDLLGVNWPIASFQFNDSVMTNDGSGVYRNTAVLPSSNSDDNEGDFLDYDNDGDLDVIIANFSGQERMYTNSDGAGSYVLAVGVLPSDGSRSLDADCCDVDNDGDTDIFVANDSVQANTFLKNNSDNADTHAPQLHRLEQALDRVVSAEPTVVRVQVYDNDAYYITWYDQAWLEVQVGAGPVSVIPMRSSLGQIFRGEIDGSLEGSITYHVVCTDKNGNTGVSSTLKYIAIQGLPVGTSFCSPGNDLVSSACPCLVSDGQTADVGHGCGNSVFSGGAILSAVGTTTPDSVQLTTSDIPAGVTTIYLQGSINLTTSSGPVQFGDGVRCAGGSLLRLGSEVDVDFDSSTSWGPRTNHSQVSVAGQVIPGNSYVYQTYYRNPNPAWCVPNTFNVTQAIELAW